MAKLTFVLVLIALITLNAARAHPQVSVVDNDNPSGVNVVSNNPPDSGVNVVDGPSQVNVVEGGGQLRSSE